MTTIAWKDGYLAADRQATSGNLAEAVTKIVKCGSFWYGMAGPTSDCISVAHWLSAGGHHDDAPSFDESNQFGIAIKGDRVYHVEGRTPSLIQIECAYTASGSGRDFAISAMAMGKTAEEAVQIACELDVFSGLGINVVRTRRAAPRTKAKSRAR